MDYISSFDRSEKRIYQLNFNPKKLQQSVKTNQDAQEEDEAWEHAHHITYYKAVVTKALSYQHRMYCLL